MNYKETRQLADEAGLVGCEPTKDGPLHPCAECGQLTFDQHPGSPGLPTCQECQQAEEQLKEQMTTDQ
jgi:hypothetical protein